MTRVYTGLDIAELFGNDPLETPTNRGGRKPWLWGDEFNPSPLYLELERRRQEAGTESGTTHLSTDEEP